MYIWRGWVPLLDTQFLENWAEIKRRKLLLSSVYHGICGNSVKLFYYYRFDILIINNIFWRAISINLKIRLLRVKSFLNQRYCLVRYNGGQWTPNSWFSCSAGECNLDNYFNSVSDLSLRCYRNSGQFVLIFAFNYNFFSYNY